MDKVHNLIIIGSGPAGLTAGLYAARAELEPLLIGGLEAGGQLMLTTEVENFPGYESILGPELINKITNHAKKFGTELLRENVTKVDFNSQPLKVFTVNREYQAKAVIIATGASARWLGLDSETKLRGKGVSSCATCDGFFFKDKEIAVVGGGDSALEEATFLTKFAKKVSVIVRRDVLRASKPLQKRAQENPKIEFIWNTEVQEVLGEDRVTGLRIKNNQTNQDSELVIEGLFVAIGHTPNTGIFKGQIDLDEKGYIKPTKNTSTSVPGVFVAGDVEDIRYRQAITAAGSGCKAALDAEKWLAEQA